MKELNRDTLVAAAIAGGCGIVIGAAMMGPWKSIAELLSKAWFYGWAAALATAAVGFGAFKYAREAHLLRESEVYESRLRQYHLDLAAYNEWRNRVISVGAGGDAFEKISAKMTLSTVPLRMHLSIARTCVSSISLNGTTTSHFALTPPMLASVFGLDGATAFLRASCEDFIRRCAALDVDAPPPPSVQGHFEDLMLAAVQAKKDCFKAKELIEALHPSPPVWPKVMKPG